MPPRHTQQGGLVLGILFLALANALLLGGYLHRSGGWFGGSIGSLVGRLADGSSVGSAFLSRQDLAEENRRLAAELQDLQHQLATAEEQVQELDFYRTVARTRGKLPSQPLEANVFGFFRESGVHLLFLNRGREDGIEEHDVVLTPEGALLGQVDDVAADTASVVMVDDPSFEVAARILGTDITGLVRVDPREGLILDLIQKDEPVREEQVVVTSGDDQFPAALLIGTIRSVDNERATLFAGVRLTPFVDARFVGRVLVLSR